MEELLCQNFPGTEEEAKALANLHKIPSKTDDVYSGAQEEGITINENNTAKTLLKNKK